MARRVPIAQRGPGQSYRPDRHPPSVFGAHQPGIATPLLHHLAFAAFDAEVAGRAELRALLAACSEAAERVMHDRDDVTVTLGLGPALFGARLGLAGARPRALAELPRFPGDVLEPLRGAAAISACRRARDTPADAGAALHAVEAAAGGALTARWSQDGLPGPRPRRRPRPHPARPPGLQERHAQPAPRARPRPPRLGRHGRSDVDGRRHLPGGAPHPARARRVGRAARRRAGAHRRAPARQRRASRRAARVRPARARRRGDRTRRARAPRRGRDQRRRRAAAAQLQLRRRRPATPACSSSPTSATRAGSSPCCSGGSPRTTHSRRTLATWAALCSHCRRAHARAASSPIGCSA